jgi:hypothetical protein
MFKMSKKAELRRGPFRRLSDSEILHFVSKTLQPRSGDQETPDFSAKLQTLTDILEQQEVDLLNWPDSPSKDRFYASHLRAKRLVVELTEIFSCAASDVAARSGTGQSRSE